MTALTDISVCIVAAISVIGRATHTRRYRRRYARRGIRQIEQYLQQHADH